MLRLLQIGCLSILVFLVGCGGGDSKNDEEAEQPNANGDSTPQNPAERLLGSGLGGGLGSNPTPKNLGGTGSSNPVLLARNRALEMKIQNNLKMVMLAIHNYHDVNRSFPPQGEGGLSWRVRILPMLGQGNLYEQFNLDEPWDSEHNKKLVTQMPDVYKTTSSDELTSLLVTVGNGAMYDGTRTPGFRNVTDGTANTIALIVAGGDKAVPWTKPADLNFDPSNPHAALGDVGPTLIFATADGRVFRRGTSSIPAETLKALITKGGGEIVNLN